RKHADVYGEHPDTHESSDEKHSGTDEESSDGEHPDTREESSDGKHYPDTTEDSSDRTHPNRDGESSVVKYVPVTDEKPSNGTQYLIKDEEPLIQKYNKTAVGPPKQSGSTINKSTSLLIIQTSITIFLLVVCYPLGFDSL
ncbi:unnamed protein product, partial [Didymodactylos carnosus]